MQWVALERKEKDISEQSHEGILERRESPDYRRGRSFLTRAHSLWLNECHQRRLGLTVIQSSYGSDMGLAVDSVTDAREVT